MNLEHSARRRNSVAPRVLRILHNVVRRLMHRGERGLFLIGELVSVFGRGFVASRWRRTMREEFAGYLYEVGLRAVPAVVVIALLVAIGLVLQILYWLGYAGQQGRIGEFLVLALVRQIAPLFTALVVIGRSGAALVDEVGQLAVSGHLRLLESCGIDPVDLLVIPRCFATALATLLLTLVFLHTALWSGYVAASVAGVTKLGAGEFIGDVFGTMSLADHAVLFTKPLLTGCAVAYISIRLGMRANRRLHGIRKALPQAFMLSLLATFLINTLLSSAF